MTTEPAYPTEVAEIEDTIKRLIFVAFTADRFPCGHPHCQGEPIPMSDMLHRSHAEIQASDIIVSPMRWGARRAVRALGSRLNEIGGWELMQDVCHRIEAILGARAAVFIDHAFDGVGHWVA